MDLVILLLCFVWVMLAAIEIADFVTGQIEEAKVAKQRKAAFNAFYAADKTLKYLKQLLNDQYNACLCRRCK